MPSAAEELTRRFYEWEKRGRGWLQFPECVELEPPFRPFYGHFIVPPSEPRDDGRRATLFSSFWDQIERRKNSPPQPEFPEELFAEPEPLYIDTDEELVELAIALPEGTRIDHDATEALLLSLVSCERALAFEIIGTRERIILQLVVTHRDATHVAEALRGFFPAAGVAETRDTLSNAWRDSGPRITIAECALAREFMLPLRTFLRADPDPLIGVFAALGTLGEEDFGAIQILFQAAREDWASSVKRATTDDEGGAFFPNAPELTRLGFEKVAHPLFAVVVRIATAADTNERAAAIAERIAGALAHFGRPDGNELVLIGNDEGVNLEADLLRRTSHRSGMLLSAGELVGFVHPPSASVVAPKLVRRMRRTKAAPESHVGREINLGTNEHAGRAVTVGLTSDERMRHLHVLGASGMGKSTFLLDLVMQSIERGRGVGVLDPHGDLVDEVLVRVPESREDDVVLVDAADAERPVGFNLLDAHSELERTLLASDLVGIFRRLSTTWGDQMQAVLANAIQAFLTSTRGGSLHDLRRFLIEQDYRQSFLETVEDEEVVYYWRREFPLLVGKPAGPILTRLDGFLRPKPLRAMLAQRESKLDFRDILDGGRIFLAKLAQGAIGTENAALLGSLFVAKFHQAAVSRQELQREARRDFDLVIDEFQDLVTPSVANILSGTRKYRLGLTAAHQSLRPVFEADQLVASALMANAATRVVFRVGEDDAKKLADGFVSFDAQALTSLGVGEAVCRIDRADHDFNLKTRVPAAVDAATASERGARIVARSRERYGIAVPVRRDDAAAPSAIAPASQRFAPPPPPGRKEKRTGEHRPRLKDVLPKTNDTDSE
ncbi:MAG TPA: type IV secretion system DNA-binding domain-containing protein [Thermoanaerobaculia bacterium]|nr:type IV secretion system DNA-binding domain-containing protein [Thermoanaerobaculia bacterium]